MPSWTPLCPPARGGDAQLDTPAGRLTTVLAAVAAPHEMPPAAEEKALHPQFHEAWTSSGPSTCAPSTAPQVMRSSRGRNSAAGRLHRRAPLTARRLASHREGGAAEGLTPRRRPWRDRSSGPCHPSGRSGPHRNRGRRTRWKAKPGPRVVGWARGWRQRWRWRRQQARGPRGLGPRAVRADGLHRRRTPRSR